MSVSGQTRQIHRIRTETSTNVELGRWSPRRLSLAMVVVLVMTDTVSTLAQDGAGTEPAGGVPTEIERILEIDRIFESNES